jgi:type I restriction enzyme S subunit
MKKIPIKDAITEKISGEWGDEVEGDEGVVVIRTANFLNTGKVNFSNLVRRKIDLKKVEKKKLITGDIIIEKSGGSPTQPVGRVVYFENPDEDTYLCNNFTTILRPDRNKVHPEFLFYLLHSNHKNGKTLRYQNKTTGIINLKLDSYLDSEIQLPSLDDQIRIAHLLGKVETLITQRKQHLQQLDDLLKSVFLEMFGDPSRNERGWTKGRIGQAIKVQGGFAFKSKDIASSGAVKLVKIANVHFENLTWNDVSYVPDSFLDVYKKFVLHEDDLLIALTRPVIKSLNVVKTAAVRKEDLPCLLNQRVARFLIDQSRIKKRFFLQFCYTEFFRKTVDGLCPPGLQPNISTNQIEEIPIFYPPVALQNDFEAIANKVEGIKFHYQSSLTKLEALYGVLSQQTFNTKLDLQHAPEING